MTRTVLVLAAAGCLLAMSQASFAAPAFGVKPALSAPAATEVGWRTRHFAYRNTYNNAYGRGHYRAFRRHYR